MKVHITNDSLQLIPQGESDQITLSRLINTSELNGYGKEAGVFSEKILHVEVPLFPIGTIRHSRPIDGLPPSGGNDIHM